MLYDYDFTNKIIDIPFGITDVLVQTLLSDIRDAEATAQGVAYGQIASASGGESLGSGVSVGITVNLLDSWQVRFAAGNYIAKIAGGNLVGGLAGDPVAYSTGVQVLLLQSAASTVVSITTGSGLSAQQDATLTAALQAAQAANLESSKGRKMQTNKAIISGDGLSVSIYDDDGSTLLHTFIVSADKNTRTPA
jgi:hypothetical protein